MFVLALGALALAVLVAVGRGRLEVRRAWRWLTLALAAATAAGALWAGLRGEWPGALLLAGSAAWLGLSARPPRAAPATAPGEVAEAASMLGISERATRAEVDAAYRRLMLRVHPDKGGAPGLAAQLNRAREVMLRRRS
jgi:hypothetical protein